MSEEEQRERIVTEAKKLIGIPFRHMGVTRGGLDCKGCCWLAYYRAGINLPQGDGKKYEVNWFWFADKQRYLDGLLKYFDFTDNPKKGDLVVFKCFDEEMITHGGIYIGNRSFIHAPSGKKVRPDSLDHRYWNKKFYKFLVYKGFKS
ncbi:MAG: NlpC/P60 family protein [Bacteroidales bacterium]|nr:NlpC/P60 family protein [Bacteroidales bacterium]